MRWLAVITWLLAFAASPSVLAQGQGTTTFTTTASNSIGSTYARYVWVTNSFGPATITVGDLGKCTLAAAPVGCSATGGSGTAAAPFTFNCGTIATTAGIGPPAPLTLSNCALPGLSHTVAAADNNIDAHEHTVTPAAVDGVAMPAPIGPWAPLGIGLAVVAAAALAARRARRRAGSRSGL